MTAPRALPGLLLLLSIAAPDARAADAPPAPSITPPGGITSTATVNADPPGAAPAVAEAPATRAFDPDLAPPPPDGELSDVARAGGSNPAEDPQIQPEPATLPPAGSARRRLDVRKSKLTRDETEITADKRRILVSQGEDKIIDLDFDPSNAPGGIVQGNPKALVTTLVRVGDKKQLVLKPLAPGDTTVTVRDTDGSLRLILSVKVTPNNLLRVASEVRTLLRDIEGLEIRIVGQKVVLEGEVLVPADYGRLVTVIGDDAYKGVTLNLVTLSPLAMTVLGKRIQEDINAFAPNVKTRVVNGLIFLEGTVDDQGQAQRASKVAQLYLPELKPGSQLEKDTTVQRVNIPGGRSLIQNFIVVNPPPPRKTEKLVRVTFNFVELSKDYNKVFGFKWQPGFTQGGAPNITIGPGADGSTQASSPTFSAVISNLFPKLQSGQAAGYARILKTSTIIVRSGQPAKLRETTDFPFLVLGQNGQVSPGNKSVGLEAAVTPLILGQSEDIQMDVNLSQSNLVGRVPAAGAAPVTADHRIETKIYVKSGESAAVAGVNSSDIGTDFNKDDPASGGFSEGTDPLFTLLRSKAYRKKKSQFVIFVTPQIIENASEGTEDLKRNFRIRVK